ncbi:DUF6371 domain-containing protein [Nafulsella turpanensis]|uniref:DUF6371 domain-containing protein n=1 Tax=Nafulsella turpanensis TaxID=1265690 RepID=UPI00034ABC3C|nr:DUF6371 domain-containing protein [Nafulsella turpanensis]
MSRGHRYILEKGSKKHLCPECNKRRFVRYIDTETGGYLPDQYGRCDRESKCSYHLNPYLDGYAKAIKEQEKGNRLEFPNKWKPQRRTVKPQSAPEPVFIPVEVFSRTRTGYEQNVFIQNLLTRIAFPFEVQDIEKVISLYHLGTVTDGYRAGAITFPFIDKNGNVRAVQVKQFDEANHTTGTDFLHSIIEKQHTWNNEPLPEWLKGYKKNDKRVSCLFGEHLLSKYPHNPIALVEAPKTAIYGTLYFGFPEQPQNLLWFAVYNLSSLNLNKCQALKGRNVYLFPDLSKGGKAFELWSRNAKDIQSQLPGTYFKVADFLEQLAPDSDKEQGNDLADYLIKQDWRLFRKRNVQEQPEPESIESSTREKSEKGVALKKTFFSQAEPTQKATNCNSFKDEKAPKPEHDFTYFDKVSSFIYTTAVGITQSRIISIEELPEAAKNPAKVVECIKQLIILAGGRLIEFNSTYSKVRIYPRSG